MSPAQRIDLDVVIFGGGAAGLWSLDRLTQAGLNAVVIETAALGGGQTLAAQGIIHGGLKYSLDGIASDSALATAAMPSLWRACLRGDRLPHLTATSVRSDWCSLWRTSSLASQIGLAGARAALQVRPVKIAAADRPAALVDCPGDVYRIDEPVIDPGSLLADLATRHRQRLLHVAGDDAIELDVTSGHVHAVRLASPGGANALELRPRLAVFTAGEGNAALRIRVGLDAGMQRRPLHMVMVRGRLPVLNGHCTDGGRTRVTITSTVDGAGRGVWQVGGQLAEDGVAMEQPALLAHARSELAAALPGFAADGLEWSSYRVDRAEAATRGGTRPSDIWCHRDGNVITGWPTKLALVPRLADRIFELIESTGISVAPLPVAALPDWPRPEVALPPWEREVEWFRDR